MNKPVMNEGLMVLGQITYLVLSISGPGKGQVPAGLVQVRSSRSKVQGERPNEDYTFNLVCHHHHPPSKLPKQTCKQTWRKALVVILLLCLSYLEKVS